MSIETPESQSAAEAADDKALVDLALKRTVLLIGWPRRAVWVALLRVAGNV